MTHPTSDTPFYRNQLKELIDFQITGVNQDHEGYLCLILQKGNYTKALWLYSDDEGNNPGSFEIQGGN